MNVTIIILVPKPNREFVNNFSGIPVKQIAYHGELFKEASAISEKRTNLLGRDLNIQCHIPGPLAEKLFNNHSRLTLICPSEIKSIHFQDKPQFLTSSCIQLYCYVKGAIPIGEKHFPSDLQGIPTDVIEGFPRFCSQKIRIGDSVTNLKVSGTIGGFCLFYGRQALLTCAHAMLDWNTLLSTGHQHHMQPESVHFETGDRMLNETLHCGRVVNHSFTHDNPRETSTDVAVIELDNGICVSEQDYVNTKGKRKIHHRELGLQSCNLHDGYIKTFQGLPGRNVEVVCAGAVSDFNSSSNTATVIKVPEWVIEREKLQSASRNLTKCITENLPTQVDIPVHMQVHAIVSAAREEEVKSQRTLRFYNQLAVSNIPFQQGDSGACVYITDGYIESGCLGMAIADYPGGGCIVTPMATLLEKLGLI
ncbi:Hypothetical predicted protein [Mytilus galloprovincialis]|nr:Hypothetical predicted protein [Mytilus galloprovincialis]